jgi:hypothetical protein
LSTSAIEFNTKKEVVHNPFLQNILPPEQVSKRTVYAPRPNKPHIAVYNAGASATSNYDLFMIPPGGVPSGPTGNLTPKTQAIVDPAEILPVHYTLFGRYPIIDADLYRPQNTNLDPPYRDYRLGVEIRQTEYVAPAFVTLFVDNVNVHFKRDQAVPSHIFYPFCGVAVTYNYFELIADPFNSTTNLWETSRIKIDLIHIPTSAHPSRFGVTAVVMN